MERELHALRAAVVEAERQLAAQEQEHGAEVRGSWVRGMLMRHPRHSCVNPASSLLHVYNHFCCSTKKKALVWSGDARGRDGVAVRLQQFPGGPLRGVSRECGGQ